MNIVKNIQATAGRNPPTSDADATIQTCSPTQPKPVKYYPSPNYEEVEVSDREAENVSDSDIQS